MATLRFHAHLSLVCILALAGCADQTSILVEVTSSELTVPDDISALEFDVTSDSGRTLNRRFTLSGAWPHSLAVLPVEGENGDGVTIVVTGYRDEAFQIRRVVEARFASGESRRVVVALSRACVGVTCSTGTDCRGGQCVRDGQDGGVEPDAGVVDGGRLDSGLVDAGNVDAHVMDAGRVDGGPPDVGPVDAGPTVVCNGAACIGALVISEFRTRSTVSAHDEFVEIHNRGPASLDISNVRLDYTTTSGATTRTQSTVPVGVIVPPGGYFLFTSGSYTGTREATPPAAWDMSFGLPDGGGTIFLVAGTTTVDLVGWGSGAFMSETGPISGSDPCEISCERKASAGSTAASMRAADATAGNAEDSDNNTNDFVRPSTADPQTSASPPEP